MKKIAKIISMAVIAVAAMPIIQSCSDSASYADLLNDENKAVNRFLADQRVVLAVPADTVFEVGENAPYYQLDEEGNIYMQVLSVGDGERAQEDQTVYFRFKRYNLSYYAGDLSAITGEGNQDSMSESATSFRYQNYDIPSSSAYGTGIQMPLNYLPLNSDVNLVVKSQYGWTSEVSYVQPYLYRIRYYKSQI